MSAATLAQAIASSPEAITQNQRVSELSREKDRLTQRVSDLAQAPAQLAAAQSALDAAIAAGAVIIENIQASLPPDAPAGSLALALMTSPEAVNSSGLITDLSLAVKQAQAIVDLYSQAQTDLTKVTADFQAAVQQGAIIITQIQAGLPQP